MPPAPAGFAGFADPAKVHAAQRRIPFERMDDPDQSDLPRPPGAPTDAPAIALGNAGNVVTSFPTNLVQGFGLVYDTSVDRIWIANTYYPDFGSTGRRARAPVPARRHRHGRDDRHPRHGRHLASRRDVQRPDRHALAGQRGRRQLSLRDGSRHEGRHRQQDLRPLDLVSARCGLRLRDRHLLRRRHQRRRPSTTSTATETSSTPRTSASG